MKAHQDTSISSSEGTPSKMVEHQCHALGCCSSRGGWCEELYDSACRSYISGDFWSPGSAILDDHKRSILYKVRTGPKIYILVFRPRSSPNRRRIDLFWLPTCTPCIRRLAYHVPCHGTDNCCCRICYLTFPSRYPNAGEVVIGWSKGDATSTCSCESDRYSQWQIWSQAIARSSSWPSGVVVGFDARLGKFIPYLFAPSKCGLWRKISSLRGRRKANPYLASCFQRGGRGVFLYAYSRLRLWQTYLSPSKYPFRNC